MAKPRLIRPKKLMQGDAVGVVAPAGPVEAASLQQGLEVVRGMGFKPVLDGPDFPPIRFLTNSVARVTGKYCLPTGCGNS